MFPPPRPSYVTFAGHVSKIGGGLGLGKGSCAPSRKVQVCPTLLLRQNALKNNYENHQITGITL